MWTICGHQKCVSSLLAITHETLTKKNACNTDATIIRHLRVRFLNALGAWQILATDIPSERKRLWHWPNDYSLFSGTLPGHTGPSTDPCNWYYARRMLSLIDRVCLQVPHSKTLKNGRRVRKLKGAPSRRTQNNSRKRAAALRNLKVSDRASLQLLSPGSRKCFDY